METAKARPAAKASSAGLSFLAAALKTLRLALPKLGVGWMFALLTSNFNRIAIHDLVVAAVLITVMIGMHHFLSPFQVIFGRLADRRAIMGLRRTPYFLVGSLVSSLVFLALPPLAVGCPHPNMAEVRTLANAMRRTMRGCRTGGCCIFGAPAVCGVT